MMNPVEIARAHFEDDGSDLSASVIESMVAAIEADRAQRYEAEPEPRLRTAAELDEIAEEFLSDEPQKIAGPVAVSELDLPDATRVEVIGSLGRVLTRNQLEPGVRILVQDGARTVKVFITEGDET